MITLEQLKHDKNSFEASKKCILDKLDDFSDRYAKIYEDLSHLLRSYESIVAKCNVLIGEYNLVFPKNITDLGLEDIVLIEGNIPDNISFEIKDRLCTDLMKIYTRKKEIVILEDKLKLINKEIYSAFYISEKDSDQELFLEDMLDAIEEKELDETVEFSKMFQEEISNEIKKDNEEKISIVDYASDDILANIDEFEKDIIVEETDDENTMLYKIEPGVSLIDIVSNIYNDATFWKNLYLSGNNKEKLDERLKGKSIEDYLYDKFIFEGVDLEIPNILVVYEEIQKHI